MKMKNRFTKIIAVVSFVLVLHTTLYTLHSYGAIPHLVNYQGRLTDSSGIPLNGSYNLTFRIYDAETAGNLLWQEIHSGVVIQKGIFSILLGSVTNLSLPFDRQYYLEIKVADEVMSPRQRIASGAYAFRAEEADKLGGKPSSDYALTSDITSTPIANKAIKLDANAKLPTVALKVYDSGWFAVSLNSTYVKTHNLGTTKCLINTYVAQNNDGSGWCVNTHADNYTAHNHGIGIVALSTTTATLRTGDNWIVTFTDSNGVVRNYNSGYCRIVIFALE